jgi:hypothetical protein
MDRVLAEARLEPGERRAQLDRGGAGVAGIVVDALGADGPRQARNGRGAIELSEAWLTETARRSADEEEEWCVDPPKWLDLDDEPSAVVERVQRDPVMGAATDGAAADDTDGRGGRS